MSIAAKLQRQHLHTLTPYASARRSMSGGSVWLNANESPYSNGYDVDTSGLNRYPEFQSAKLLQAYADYAEVRSDQVLIGRGSDEAIDVLIRTYCEPGQDAIMICPPTYGMYAISAATHGAAVKSVPLTDNWQLDLNQIKANLAGVKLVFLCNPSNPLGNALESQTLTEVLEAVDEQALVIVDEAYIEYAALAGINSVSQWLQKYPQLVVLRTLSKAFGLAGIRCGFALAGADVIAAMQKVLAPYPLPDLTVQVAIQALASGACAQMQQRLAETITERERVQQQLEQLSYVEKLWPSVTNFILVQVTDAAKLVSWCQQQGILIRNQSAQVGLSNTVRITVGSETENNELIASLNAITQDFFS
ncbi:MAG: histidinol-phosphate transaminase [Idiomarina sp.]